MAQSFTRFLWRKKDVKSNPYYQEIKREIRKGTKKQEIFETYGPKIGSKQKTIDILLDIPSNTAIKRFAYPNWVLLLLVLFIAGGYFYWVDDPPRIMIIFMALAIATLIFKWVNYYYWFTVLFGFMFIVFLSLISEDEPFLHWYGLLSSIFTPIIISLLIWLPRRLSPYPKETREFYNVKDGNRRVRTMYQFSD